MTLEGIALNLYNGEKEIVWDLISKGYTTEFILEVCSDQTLNLDLKKVENFLENYSLIKELDDFIYVPSIDLWVAKETTPRQTWEDSHKILQENKERMLTSLEFIEFLKYVKKDYPQIYNDVVKWSYSGEWIDTSFRIVEGKTYVNSNHLFDLNKGLIPLKSEILDPNTLISSGGSNISLSNFLRKNHTSQGLPNKKVRSGSLLYYFNGDYDSNMCFYVDSTPILSCIGNVSTSSIRRARSIYDLTQ